MEHRRAVIGSAWDEEWRECAGKQLSLSSLTIVTDSDAFQAARFLISQQKYLESLEAQRRTEALSILRLEITPVDIEAERLQHLSR